MAITDLLPKGSIPRLGALSRRRPPEAPDAVSDAPAPPASAPDVLFAGVPLPSGARSVTPASTAASPRRRGTGRRPMPSHAVLAIGALSLVCLTLAAALLLAAYAPPTDAYAASIYAPDDPAPSPAAPAAGDEPDGVSAAAPGDTSVADSADPTSLPADLLTRLEAAADAPLPTELALFLEAVQHGFGTESAQLEPTLRSYAYRMVSRFEWNPDSYQIAVTAPDAALAEARAAMLGRLFSTAVASGRLTIRAATGPHALSLVTA